MFIFNRSILTDQKVVVLTKVVFMVPDCIQKKPGEPCPGSETGLHRDAGPRSSGAAGVVPG